MTENEGITTLTDSQLEDILHRAAMRGAREALKQIGLGDDHAGEDVHDLRNLLTAWRDTKRSIWQQFVKMTVTVLLMAMAGGLAMMVWASGSGE